MVEPTKEPNKGAKRDAKPYECLKGSNPGAKRDAEGVDYDW